MMTLNNVVMLGNLVKNYEGYWLKSKDIFIDQHRNKRAREITILLECDGPTQDDFDRSINNGIYQVLIQGPLCIKRSPRYSNHYLSVKKYIFIICEKCDVSLQGRTTTLNKKLVNVQK